MEIDVDARGLGCPLPVIRTKETLGRASGPFTVMVDNDAARDNVRRFAENSGCGVEIEDAEGCFLLTVTPGETVEAAPMRGCPAGAATVFFIKSDEIGTGDRALGATLAKSFLYACAEAEDGTGTYVIMNSGVRLATENEETVAHLKMIEERGSEILVCGTCLDFYGLKDSLKVGRVSNMYEIRSVLIGAGAVVSL